MNYSALFPVSLMGIALASCDFNQPIPNQTAYDLGIPYGSEQPQETGSTNLNQSVGSYLQVVTPSATLYSTYPKGNEQPSKILSTGSEVKVISMKGSYLKVEVVNTGDVGYVPSIMLGEKRSQTYPPYNPEMGNRPSSTGNTTQPEIPDIQPPELGDPSRPAL